MFRLTAHVSGRVLMVGCLARSHIAIGFERIESKLVEPIAARDQKRKPSPEASASGQGMASPFFWQQNRKSVIYL